MIVTACKTPKSESSGNLPPTNTATPPSIVVKTTTPIITITPEPPTPTPTMAHVVDLIPRYLLPSTSYLSNNLESQCTYQNDTWDLSYAYKAVSCPDIGVIWLSMRFTNFEEGQTAKDIFGDIPPESYTSIEPGGNLSQFENISLSAKLENSEYSFFIVYETDKYMISSEVFFDEDESVSIEEFYLDNADYIFYIVIENMLDIVNFNESTPELIPMTVNQQVIYDQSSDWLVTWTEANEFYKSAADMWGDPMDGAWLSLGEKVYVPREGICRDFYDRTNADAP